MRRAAHFRVTLSTYLLFSLLTCPLALGQPAQPSRDATRQRPEPVFDNPPQKPDVPWNLLEFDKKRAITKVRVKLYRRGGFVDRPAVEAEVESDDPLVLANFSEGLTHGLTYTPKSSDGAAWGSEPFGELEVITNKDFFRLYFDLRFVLEDQYWKADRWFFCWTLAKSIDDLLADKTGKRLAQSQFEMLSGEDWLRAEREGYKKRVDEAKKKSPAAK